MKRLRILSLDIVPGAISLEISSQDIDKVGHLGKFSQALYISFHFDFFCRTANGAKIREFRESQACPCSSTFWSQLETNAKIQLKPTPATKIPTILLNLFSSNPHSPHPLPTPFNTSSTRCIRHRTKSKPGVVTVYPTQEGVDKGYCIIYRPPSKLTHRGCRVPQKLKSRPNMWNENPDTMCRHHTLYEIYL